jgi:hypothetical protein
VLGEQRLLQAAWEQFQDVRSRYGPVSVDESKLREIERLVQAGWRELCGAERTSPKS